MKITINVPGAFPFTEIAHLLNEGWQSKSDGWKEVMRRSGYGDATFTADFTTKEIIMEVKP